MNTNEQSFKNDVRSASDGIESAFAKDANGNLGIGSDWLSSSSLDEVPGLKLLRTVNPSSIIKSLLLMVEVGWGSTAGR